jgi:RNA polymerase sigma-70 factor (ECF subfamily)
VKCVFRAWEQHEAELRGWLRRRLANDADAEDQLQDLFLRALRQGERFCAVENARAWLFEVARNALADRLRVSRQMVALPEDLAAVSDETATIDDLTACLPRVLSELDADDREAIVLCDLEGMTQDDYARLKGLSLPGAKSRVQRARKRLRERLTLNCQVRLGDAGQVVDFVPRPPLE